MTQIDPHIPYSPDMEVAVLGAVLTNPDNYYVVANRLRRASDFFLVRHQWIWKCITELARQTIQFDYLMIAHLLEQAGQLENIGGEAYLIHLINNTPQSTHAESYAELVRRAAIRRRILQAAEVIKETVQNDEMALETVIEQVESQLFNALVDGTETRTQHIRQAASDYYDQVSSIQAGRQDYLGIPTGYREIDQICKGAQPGQLIYVAGRPGMGKTALLLNFALHAARMRQRVFVWSGEMNVRENMARLIAIDSQIDTQRLQLGQMSDQEFSRFTEVSLNRLPDMNLWIDDTAGITVNKLQGLLTRHATLYGLDLVMVDYVGLMRSGNRRQRNEEMGEISRGLKRLAMDLNVPVYAASQLNRDCETRQDKRPILRDLRDSGDLEQDANVVMFLYRDVVYDAATVNPDAAEVIIAKNRNGPTGTAMLRYDRTITRFENAQMEQVSLNGNNPVRHWSEH